MKLRYFFNVKHDAVYRSVYATADSNANYIVECARRLNERVKDHNGQDRKSHMVKHTIDCGHEPVSKDNFKIIANGFGNNTPFYPLCQVLAEDCICF